MPLRGDDGPPPNFQLGQVGAAAQSGLPMMELPAGQSSWMPASMQQQVPGLLQMLAAQGPDPGAAGMRGGGGPRMSGLPPQYIESNWGPPPPLNEETAPGWFPSQFNNRGPGSTGKFWTMKDYERQRFNKYGGQPPEIGDERPNTLDWRLLGNNSPGDFMFLGHHIGMGKLNEDLHQGQNPDFGEGGSNRPPIRRIQGRGPENPASFIHGGAVFTGLPGQLENWAGGQPYWT